MGKLYPVGAFLSSETQLEEYPFLFGKTPIAAIGRSGPRLALSPGVRIVATFNWEVEA